MRQLLLLFLLVLTTGVLAQDEPVPSSTEMQVPADIPEFSIKPRIPELTYYPCTQCHQFMTPNPEIRELRSPHPAILNHGDERIWCLTCHKIDDRDKLTNLLGEDIDFDEAPTLCASCHMQRHRDWAFGGHGKRVANWQGEREVWSCPECHDPHEPAIKLRPPKPAPPLRKGLQPLEKDGHEYKPLWEDLEERHSDG